jgi:hypothetical protein
MHRPQFNMLLIMIPGRCGYDDSVAESRKPTQYYDAWRHPR